MESMPSRRSSSDSVKPRRGRPRNTPPPTKPPSKKVNGSAASVKGTKNKEDEATEDKIDLSRETACRLCDKKDFRVESDALAKHYATAHFKAVLESEIKNDNTCYICKAKKLRSNYGSRKELMLHLATLHSRAENLLADELGLPVENSKQTK